MLLQLFLCCICCTFDNQCASLTTVALTRMPAHPDGHVAALRCPGLTFVRVAPFPNVTSDPIEVLQTFYTCLACDSLNGVRTLRAT
jgi:hypothetical protein